MSVVVIDFLMRERCICTVGNYESIICYFTALNNILYRRFYGKKVICIYILYIRYLNYKSSIVRLTCSLLDPLHDIQHSKLLKTFCSWQPSHNMFLTYLCVISSLCIIIHIPYCVVVVLSKKVPTMDMRPFSEYNE